MSVETVRSMSTWRGVVHDDREAALASTAADDIAMQPVSADCWRVVNSAAAWDDPAMLLGFVQRTGSRLECTLLADLQRVERVSDIDGARAFFVLACSQGLRDV